jgi:hypothetical protein
MFINQTTASFNVNMSPIEVSRESSVGIATIYVVERPVFDSRLGQICLFSDRLWDPSSLLSNGYGGGSFPRAKVVEA